jgi:hypothetical protein
MTDINDVVENASKKERLAALNATAKALTQVENKQ